MPTCKGCEREFVSDRTPMAQMDICLRCRATQSVTCEQCGGHAFGAPDGLLLCGHCRHEGYLKKWIHADTTGGRLVRLQLAGMSTAEIVRDD